MYDKVRVTLSDGSQYETKPSMSVMSDIIIRMYEGNVEGYEMYGRDYFDEEPVDENVAPVRNVFARFLDRTMRRRVPATV